MNELQALLDKSSRNHDHLCPRQILGVRIGLAGLKALGFSKPPVNKRLLVILETDGCFADGVIAATGCTVGHRTLRVEDYGKTAASFVDIETSRTVRLAPALDSRSQADLCAPEESGPYLAQMKAYQILPDEKLLTVAEIHLRTPIEQIVSRPGLRAICALCGEEILNEREVIRDGTVMCRTCAGSSYYRDPVPLHRFGISLPTA